MIKTNSITIGIDIGTQTTKVVVLGIEKESQNPFVVATGTSQTEGMRLGYINNIDQVANSIKKAVTQAEKTLGSKIKKAYVSIGGISLSSVTSNGSAIIAKADQEITKLDINKALADSENNLETVNKKIIHSIPIAYKIDGKEIHGRPEGMHGVKLEIKTLFITCLKQNIEDLITALGLANIEPIDIIASPIAESNIILSQRQKIAGCALVNIGAETVSVAVFENGYPIALQVFSIGSMDITKDIALGLRIDLDEAESLKLGSLANADYSKKKIDEIIEARLIDIFELIENYLKRLRRNELLPAGIILIGGGSHINNIENISKNKLKLPSRVGPTDISINNKLKIRDHSWYTVFGLVIQNIDNSINTKIDTNNKKSNQLIEFFKSLFSQLLP